MKNKSFFRFIFFLLIVFSLCGLNINSAKGGEELREAADFRLKGLESNEVALSQFRGKPVILFFWASWCYHCVRVLPSLREVKEDFAEQELEILAINYQESHRRVRSFAKKYKANYKMLLDSNGAVFNLYDIYGIPAVVLVDKDGFIRYRGLNLPSQLDYFLK